MTTRADLIEAAYSAYMAHRPVYSLETGEVDACVCGQRLDPDGWHRHSLTAAFDAVLPQITTVEQLRTLPARTWLLGTLVDTPHLLLRGSMDGKHLDRYLSVYGPLTVWQPRPDQEPDDA